MVLVVGAHHLFFLLLVTDGVGLDLDVLTMGDERGVEKVDVLIEVAPILHPSVWLSLTVLMFLVTSLLRLLKHLKFFFLIEIC